MRLTMSTQKEKIPSTLKTGLGKQQRKRKRSPEDLQNEALVHAENRLKYEAQLREVEEQILYMERQHLVETSMFGNMIVGWSIDRISEATGVHVVPNADVDKEQSKNDVKEADTDAKVATTAVVTESTGGPQPENSDSNISTTGQSTQRAAAQASNNKTATTSTADKVTAKPKSTVFTGPKDEVRDHHDLFCSIKTLMQLCCFCS